MSGQGNQIAASDFVAIQNKAESLLGIGSGTRGYGQPLQSSDVFTGNTITKAQWDALRFDITSIRLHQDGVLPSIVTVNKGDPIGFGASSPNTNYDTLLEIAANNRFKLAQNQSVVINRGLVNSSASWSSTASATITITFGNSTTARHFFNTGGKVRITSALQGGASTSQVNSWSNLLNVIGVQSFGADASPIVNYYTLSNTYQTFYQSASSAIGAYTSNLYRLEARTNVANNSNGDATALYIKVTLTDAYTSPVTYSPGGVINGTLSIAVTELKAAGVRSPGGLFTVTSPEVSISPITVL
jgi:hypothetical protein